jgi:hypothetical protein
MKNVYDDAFPTCAQTFATLRVYGVEPPMVTALLRIEPHSTQRRGAEACGQGRPSARLVRYDGGQYRIPGFETSSRRAPHDAS